MKILVLKSSYYKKSIIKTYKNKEEQKCSKSPDYTGTRSLLLDREA
jgi:hypothetical protein